MSSFNPRPSSFMGVLAWAATEARLKGFAFCPLAGERVGGCAVEWLSRSFDAMSPTHKFDVEVTDLAKGTHTTFAVIRKQRTYRATGKTTVRYNTPVGNFSTFDEVNAALVAEALAAGVEGEGEVAEVEAVQAVAYPVVGIDVLAGLSLGRTQQIEQRQMQRADGVTDASLRVLGEIKVERGRQQAQEGWTPEHDDAHTDGALAQAAATYALAAAGAHPGRLLETWPWDLDWLKATDPRRDLIKAGALIVAEIERLDRADGPHEQPEQRHYAGAVAEASEEEKALTRYQKSLGLTQSMLDTKDALGMAYQAVGAIECDASAYGKDEDRALAVLGASVVILTEEVAELQRRLRDPFHSQFSTTRMDTRDLLLITRGFSLGLYKTGYTRGQFMDACGIETDADMNHLMALIENVEDRARELGQDGPHQQPEQQQVQALAVAVAGFEPECRQCAALLDAKGQCPICPRPTPWEPCETGVRHHQTIPESREVAYTEHRKADRAATRARAEGAEPARQRRLDEASQDAWTAYRRWRDADNFAARAGAHDHLRWADL